MHINCIINRKGCSFGKRSPRFVKFVGMKLVQEIMVSHLWLAMSVASLCANPVTSTRGAKAPNAAPSATLAISDIKVTASSLHKSNF